MHQEQHTGRPGAIAATALALVLGLAAAAAGAAEGEDIAVAGKQRYIDYCGVCHGMDAKGGGPFASMMTTAPPDLTTLASRNNGEFPFNRVYDTMDGRTMPLAHGTTDMPVWGRQWKAKSMLGAETELHDVEPHRPAAERLEDVLVTSGCRRQVRSAHGHVEQVVAWQRPFAHEQRFESREVAAFVAGGCDALVGLRDADVMPAEHGAAQQLDHAPRRAAPGQRDERLLPLVERGFAGSGDLEGGARGGGLGIRLDDQSHGPSARG